MLNNRVILFCIVVLGHHEGEQGGGKGAHGAQSLLFLLEINKHVKHQHHNPKVLNL